MSYDEHDEGGIVNCLDERGRVAPLAPEVQKKDTVLLGPAAGVQGLPWVQQRGEQCGGPWWYDQARAGGETLLLAKCSHRP